AKAMLRTHKGRRILDAEPISDELTQLIRQNDTPERDRSRDRDRKGRYLKNRPRGGQFRCDCGRYHGEHLHSGITLWVKCQGCAAKLSASIKWPEPEWAKAA